MVDRMKLSEKNDGSLPTARITNCHSNSGAPQAAAQDETLTGTPAKDDYA
jgi:hypothetical protein